jgi:hypothetical protein
VSSDANNLLPTSTKRVGVIDNVIALSKAFTPFEVVPQSPPMAISDNLYVPPAKLIMEAELAPGPRHCLRPWATFSRSVYRSVAR